MGAGSKRLKIKRKKRRDSHNVNMLIPDKWLCRFSIIALSFRGPYRRLWSVFDNWDPATVPDNAVVPKLLAPWGKRKEAEAIATLLNKEVGDVKDS